MTVTYTVNVHINTATQEELFETFGELVDLCIDLANSKPTAHIEVDELDPSKMSYSDE